jgi:predicted DNA-binding transcriptional regulator YafY
MLMKVRIDYTNFRGERGYRFIEPVEIYYGSTEFHQEEQWLLVALDIEKQEYRYFAMQDIHSWESN